jgi:riboflavin transporter FmnP
MKRKLIVAGIMAAIGVVVAAIALPLLLDVERHRPRIERPPG